jgi:hypothetical protein
LEHGAKSIELLRFGQILPKTACFGLQIRDSQVRDYKSRTAASVLGEFCLKRQCIFIDPYNSEFAIHHSELK